MRKIILIYFVILFCCCIVVINVWVSKEILEKIEENKSVILISVLFLFVLCIINIFAVKSYRYLKSRNINKYVRIRKATIVVCFITTVLLPCSIFYYFDSKVKSLERDAKKSLNNVIESAGAYIEYNDDEYFGFEEIQPEDNMKPDNQITKDWCYNFSLEQGGATPYNGIYRCFNIKTFGYQVVFLADAKLRGFSSDDSPALFYGWIRPYRIRYYSSDNINPSRDLMNVLPSFIYSFMRYHNAQIRDKIIDNLFSYSLNDYYEISPVPNGDELWEKNKLYYENDIIQQRSYEYKTINYGNYDITYCIVHPCKLGICEKYIFGNIFGIKFHGDASAVNRNETLTICGFVWLIFLCIIIAIFYYGNPIRK